MRILAVILLLIAYGSLYPGDFSAPAEGAVQRFLNDFRWFTSRGDVLGNIALFFPLGIASILFLPARTGRRSHLFGLLALALVYAFLLQLGQVWLPSRSAAMADVLWNMVGTVLGVAAGMAWTKTPSTGTSANTHILDRQSLMPFMILALWLLTELLPLVPSLDLQKFKDALKPLAQDVRFSFPQALMHAGGVVAAGCAFHALQKRPSMWLASALGVVLLGKIVVVNLALDASFAAGILAGYVACISMSRLGRTTIMFEAALVLLLAAWTISSLTPFSPASGGTFNAIPFATMLNGSMETAAQGLAGSLFIYTAMLWLMQRMEVNANKAAAGLAVWASLLELIQMGLLGRTADVTEPILLLTTGWVLSAIQRGHAPPPLSRAIDEDDVRVQRQVDKTPMRSHRAWWFMQLLSLLCLAVPIWLLLRMPGIPYNVREMFLGDGHFFFVIVFAGALLWLGVGAVWMSKKILSSKLPVLSFCSWTLVVSLISLLLLVMSVTRESIDDIAGANNLYWFVVNKDMWGGTWRDVFLLIGPGVIGPIERLGRYSAVYAPMLIFLVLIFSFFYLHERKSLTLPQAFLLVGSALPWLWLAKAVTFDWSSTDNLNELVARDGPMGWGGGGYLYVLLVLLCVNAVIMEHALRRLRRLSVVIVASLAALPLGWGLLNLGLEPNVEKYGYTFSGAQFLLGPDREHLLTDLELFMRWCAVQTGFVLVTATGIFIGLLNPYSTSTPDHSQADVPGSCGTG